MDSNIVCNWQLYNDRIYLSCATPTEDSIYYDNRTYQILFYDDNKLVLKNLINKNCLEYLKMK